MITEEQQTYITSILGEVASNQARKNLRNAAYIAAYRDASAKLLKEFDIFCNEHGIEYFLFSNSLEGAHVYQDFVPGAKAIRVAMLSKEVDKLSKLIPEGKKIKGNISWTFVRGDGAKHVANRLNPTIKGFMCEPVIVGGQEMFDDQSISKMVENPSFNISVFYSVPDDFYTMRYFYERIDKVNSKAKKLDRVADGKLTRNPLLKVENRNKFVSKAYKLAKKYEDCDTEYCARLLGSRSKKMKKEVLSSRKRVMFHGVEAWGIGGDNPWTRDPIISVIPDDLKYLQNCALEIAQEIHRVCKELGIGYFACGGTMLGYVRHGGFIPWDDDIDLGMLRVDYERFLKEAPGLLDTDRFFLQTRKSDPNIPYLFSKVRMNNTLYITEYNKYRDFHKGICVDIFPFDEVPNSASSQAAMKDSIRKLSKQHGHIVNNQFGAEQVVIDDGRKTLDHYIAHIKGSYKWRKYCGMSLQETQQAYDRAVTKYSYSDKREKYRYVASFVPTYTMIRKQDLLPYKEVDFAGIKLNMPAKPETFLAMQYGDFMTLPPLHKRVGHNLLEMGDIEL